MKIRHIDFEVIIADSFYYPENNGIDNGHLWPITDDKNRLDLTILIKFEWDEQEDVMDAAESALDRYIKGKYPGKNYKIYYWWWKD